MTMGNIVEVLVLVVGSISTPNELAPAGYEIIETHSNLHA
jgi:hypothetical protein